MWGVSNGSASGTDFSTERPDPQDGEGCRSCTGIRRWGYIPSCDFPRSRRTADPRQGVSEVFTRRGSAVAPALCNRYGADGRGCISGRPSVDWQAPPDRVCRASAAGNMCGSCWRPCVADMSYIPPRGGRSWKGGAAIEGATAERMWEPSRKWNRNRGGVTKRGCNRGEPQQGGRNRRGSRMGCRRGGSHCRLGAVTGKAGPQPERCGPETDGNGDRNCKKRRP